jgi:hypothetical protein
MMETYNGNDVIAVECDSSQSCKFCVFDDDDASCNVASCVPWNRDDGLSVYFVNPSSIKRKISKERIVELALKNGFKLKQQPEGPDALNPYVFDFVADIIKELE